MRVATGRLFLGRKNILKRSILFVLAFIISLAALQPANVMALALLDQASQPKQPSVLSAQKVDIAQTQATSDATTKTPTTPKKVDHTPDHELTSKRTAFSSTYMNKDGTKSLQYSKKQINYKKNGRWEKLDNQIKDVKKAAPAPQGNRTKLLR